VARALGAGFQQIHFGHRLARLGNPRLLAMTTRGINPDPHPMA
jgi:ribosomal protein S12 methylthiotransferase accessory factor